MTQDEVLAQRRGHAIEVRINAEDPAGGAFLPSPGRITRLDAPDGLRRALRRRVRAGDEVSQYYDNLVGKLVVWGKDRPTAIARTISALEETLIEGVATTIPADLAILRHPDFVNVEHSTKWVEETPRPVGVAAPAPPSRPAVDDGDEPPALVAAHDDRRGQRQALRRHAVGSRSRPTSAPARQARRAARSRGRSAGSGAGGAAGSGDVTVPMQGTIVKVLVEVGQQVDAGQAVVVLEAMKMENQITAERGGTVKEIKVAAGDTVGGGDVVAVIE